MSNIKNSVLNSLLILAIAALAACGGGGGGGGSSNNNVDKLDIVSPANGSQVINLDGYIELRQKAPYERLFVTLNKDKNGAPNDITAYFDSSLKVKLTAVQGLLKEGRNTLQIGATGMDTETSVFFVDVTKPIPIISDVNMKVPLDVSSAPQFNLAIRKGQMQSLQYSNDGGGNFSDVTGAVVSTSSPAAAVSGVSINTNPVVADDTKADIIFDILDDTVPIVDGGNSSKVSFALPGREFNAASAVQINNAALDVVEGWLPEIVQQLLVKFNGGDTPRSNLILNFEQAGANGQNICAQIKSEIATKFSTNVLNADIERCQVFVSDITLLDSGAAGLADDFSVGMAVTDSVQEGAKLTANVAQLPGAKITFDVEVAIYKDSDYQVQIETELARLRLPMQLTGIGFAFDFILSKGLSGNVDLSLPSFLNAADVADNNLPHSKSQAVNVTVNNSVGAFEPGACVPTVADTCSSNPTIPTFTVGEIAKTINENITSENVNQAEVAIDERIGVLLFCNAQAGGDLGVCDGAEVTAARQARTGILFKAGTEKNAIKYDGIVQATRIDKTKASLVQPVTGNAGLYLQMAASSETVKQDESGATIPNADFNHILGTLFQPLDISSGLYAKNLGTNTDGDMFVAITANILNQYVVSAFQAGLADKQKPTLNMCHIFSQCSSKNGQLYYDPSTLPSVVTDKGFTMPRIGRYDEAKLSFMLDSMPTIELVPSSTGGYIELNIKGLDVRANIIADSSKNKFDYVKAELCSNSDIQVSNDQEACYIGHTINVAVGDSIGTGLNFSNKQATALYLLTDVTARIHLQKDPDTHLPKLSISPDDVSLGVIEMRTFLDDKYNSVKDSNNLALIAARDILFQQLITAADITVQVSNALKPILEDLNTELVEENVYTFKANDLGLAEAKQLEAVLTSFGVSEKGDYLIFGADICDNSESVTNLSGGCKEVYSENVKGLVTLKVTN